MATKESQLARAQLVLPVSDMKAAREWYTRALGFETVYLHADPDDDPEGNYAVLKRDAAELHLILDETQDESQRDHPWTIPGSGYLFLAVDGVDALFEEAVARGIAIRRGIQTEAWGPRAFQLSDPSGNLILVANQT